MSLVLLIGPKQVDQIHWTVFVPLGLIIHITFNNMRNPGYKDRPDSVQENWVGEWIPAVRAPRHGGQAGGHRLSKNGHMSIHRWLNNWTWDGELLNLIFTWGFRRMNHIIWVMWHESFYINHYNLLLGQNQYHFIMFKCGTSYQPVLAITLAWNSSTIGQT